MGISLLSCYHGAQIFEIYGLGKEVGPYCFPISLPPLEDFTVARVQHCMDHNLQHAFVRGAKALWQRVAFIGVVAVGLCAPCAAMGHRAWGDMCRPAGLTQVVDLAFKGSVSRIGGMSIADLQREAESFWLKVRAYSHCSCKTPNEAVHQRSSRDCTTSAPCTVQCQNP